MPAVPARAATPIAVAVLVIATAAAAAVAQAPPGPFQVLATTKVGPQPGKATYGYGAVWTLNANGSVSRLDATTGSLLAYFEEPTTNGYAEGVSTRSRSSNAAPTGCRASRASVTGPS